jgi:integrase
MVENEIPIAMITTTKTDIDLKARTIRVLQQKSRNYDQPVYIEIKMGEELFDAVMRSVWSGINCPYLIHMRPTRIYKAAREAKPHPFAVLPDYLTKAYSKVRDEIGVYDHLPAAQRPGIHSLRALGIWAYHKAGYSDEYIMALAGHATEAMKAHYIEGHEKPKPITVNADLSLSGVDFSDVNWETDLSPKLKQLAESGE